MLYSGTDPELYISEYTLVCEGNRKQWIHSRFQVRLSGTGWSRCRAAIRNHVQGATLPPLKT